MYLTNNKGGARSEVFEVAKRVECSEAFRDWMGWVQQQLTHELLHRATNKNREKRVGAASTTSQPGL